MPGLFQRFTRNTKGRDFAVGDIHGHFARLEAALVEAGFDAARDRLFSVGDLVDRGPESERALDFIDLTWFHAVRGNHEDMAIRWPLGNMGAANYAANGGAWNVGNPAVASQAIADALSMLPIAIEVETTGGPVGIVHADCPFDSWRDFVTSLEAKDLSRGMRKAVLDSAMWSRDRIRQEDRSGVADVRAVVVGHTPLSRPVVLGNVYHIDTGGWQRGGRFTLIELESLAAAPLHSSQLDWAGASSA